MVLSKTKWVITYRKNQLCKLKHYCFNVLHLKVLEITCYMNQLKDSEKTGGDTSAKKLALFKF